MIKKLNKKKIVPDICGLENNGISGRIVRGREAKPNQFPWVVALFSKVADKVRKLNCNKLSMFVKWPKFL